MSTLSKKISLFKHCHLGWHLLEAVEPETQNNILVTKHTQNRFKDKLILTNEQMQNKQKSQIIKINPINDLRSKNKTLSGFKCMFYSSFNLVFMLLFYIPASDEASLLDNLVLNLYRRLKNMKPSVLPYSSVIFYSLTDATTVINR